MAPFVFVFSVVFEMHAFAFYCTALLHPLLQSGDLTGLILSAILKVMHGYVNIAMHTVYVHLLNFYGRLFILSFF